MAAPLPVEFTATDISVEPPCEHPAHATDSPWHADGDPYYARFIAPCGHFPPGIMVFCAQWIATVMSVHCGACDGEFLRGDALVVLGPVRDF
jgi:hypothetical protein